MPQLGSSFYTYPDRSSSDTFRQGHTYNGAVHASPNYELCVVWRASGTSGGIRELNAGREARPRRFKFGCEFRGSVTRSADAPRTVVGETRSRTDDAAEIPRRVVHRGELAALSMY